MAVFWGTPTPVTTRVVQMDPGPIPTLTASIPLSTSASAASLVAILPAMICAAYGGGTGLPTQRECLEMMDCYGTGKADKLAEIIAAVVLAGDVSLSSAILAHDRVSSHEKMGRNR